MNRAHQHIFSPPWMLFGKTVACPPLATGLHVLKAVAAGVARKSNHIVFFITWLIIASAEDVTANTCLEET
jgi:hypothetical protein